MPFQCEFEVANPSSYPRDDYVEVDMEKKLGVPVHLNEASLKLSQIMKKPDALPGEVRQLSFEIPFQIDKVFGENSPKRVLTFLSRATPPGPEDYSRPTATFMLEEATPKDFMSERAREICWIGHYYEKPEPGEPPDGFNKKWLSGRKVYGVKLFSDVLEVYFSLVPHPRQWTEINLAGAVTSVVQQQARDWTNSSGEMLSPYQYPAPHRVHWGRLTHVAFYPLPWERKWFHKIPLLEEAIKDSSSRVEVRERKYKLVWSHTGPIRSVVTLKSEPLTIRYEGKPYFTPDTVDVTCHLYRVISIYPGKKFYVEQLYVRTEGDLMLAFRPYFTSSVNLYPCFATELSRFEHMPDFFAVWKHFAGRHYGYGFASDTHVRDVDVTLSPFWSNTNISWRLQSGNTIKCLHYFMLKLDLVSPPLDPFKEIGHFGWYENVLKPLRALPIVPDLPHDPMYEAFD